MCLMLRKANLKRHGLRVTTDGEIVNLEPAHVDEEILLYVNGVAAPSVGTTLAEVTFAQAVRSIAPTVMPVILVAHTGRGRTVRTQSR